MRLVVNSPFAGWLFRSLAVCQSFHEHFRFKAYRCIAHPYATLRSCFYASRAHFVLEVRVLSLSECFSCGKEWVIPHSKQVVTRTVRARRIEIERMRKSEAANGRSERSSSVGRGPLEESRGQLNYFLELRNTLHALMLVAWHTNALRLYTHVCRYKRIV